MTVTFDPDALQALVLAHGNDIALLKRQVKQLQHFEEDHGGRLDNINDVLSDVAAFAGKTAARFDKLVELAKITDQRLELAFARIKGLEERRAVSAPKEGENGPV